MSRLLLAMTLSAASAGLTPASAKRGAFGFDDAALERASYFEQALDHFGANSATFSQAYFTNDEHYAGGPVFLYIGGEGPLSSSSVTHNFIVDWLPTVGGLLFALEHRYYGCHNVSSCPYTPSFNGSATDELQYLTTDQALADLATFAKAQKARSAALASVPWILIGGSYPGMLAAFGRTAYPDVFDCAVASSAPVHGQLDFTGFQEVVTHGYAMDVEGVHGSPQCAAQIAQGHASIQTMLLTAAGRAQLATLFPAAVPDAAWLEDSTNARTFAGCGVASFPAQSNHPTCTTPACGVSQICAIMAPSNASKNDNATALKRLAMVAAAQAGDGADMTFSCEMDWQMPGDIPKAHENYWGWQCCTEYGFYQTCEEGTECFYTQGLVSFSNQDHQPDDYCSSQFGINREQTKAWTTANDARWTSSVANATKIMWVNGDLDPWHALSNLASPGEEQPVVWPVKGAHHCAWMSAAAEDDQQSIKDARAAVYKQVSEWVGL